MLDRIVPPNSDPRDTDPKPRLLAFLTEEDLATFAAEAAPLTEGLLAAIHTYATEHRLSMMAAWLATDMVADAIGRTIVDALTDP